jgi:hypothetical protein
MYKQFLRLHEFFSNKKICKGSLFDKSPREVRHDC